MNPVRFPSRVRACALASIFAIALGGCRKEAPPPPMPPLVTVIRVQPGSVPVTAEFIGRAVSPYDVELRAQVSGLIREKHMKDGATVKAGDLLFVIEDTPYRAACEVARASVKTCEVNLANAEKSLSRVTAVTDVRAISEKDRDDAQNAVNIARATLEAAKANLTKAAWDLENTRVKAPVAGTLGSSAFDVGAPVQAGGAPLVRLQQYDPIWVTFTIPETRIHGLAQGLESKRITDLDMENLRADLVLTSGKPYPVPGRMNFSDVNVRNDVAAVDARAVFANPDRALMPGQFFRVTLSGPKRTGVYLIPQRAVIVNPSDCTVLVVKHVVKDGREFDIPERRTVVAGEWHGDKWVIESGLNPGDRVIVEGMLARMIPGIPVRVVEAGEPAAKPQAASAR